MKYYVNLAFLIFLILLATVSSVFAQIDETPQPYGAEPMVDLSFQLMEPGDNVELQFVPDADLIEIIVMTWDDKGGHMEVFTDFDLDPDKEHSLALVSSHDVWFRTVNGVTAVTYITSDDGTEISVILNGKLVIQYTDGEIDPSLGGRKPDHFKETIDWAYSAENFVMD